MKLVKFIKRGFTLMELLVAIMIIGILAAVAVPQYQKAVMKSRFAAMMPIAKTLANANEVYYAEHDEYSTDPAKLNVTPQAGTPDGTAINMYSNPEEVSFVRVENPSVPNARYVVYQKLSENFPETTWCEAGDTRTEELCVALGGTLPEGLTGNSSGDNTNYKAYLLTGLARSGDSFAETEPPTCPENAVCDEEGNVTGCNAGYKLSEGSCVEIPPCQGAACDEQGNITECANGLTLNNGECEDCATAFPNATACSTTSYAPTECATGYVLNGTTCELEPECEGDKPADQTKGCGKNYTSGTKTRSSTCSSTGWTWGNWDTGSCEADPTLLAQLQSVADQQCPEGGNYTCTIMDGTVLKCDTRYAAVTEEGECMATTTDTYATIYNQDGTKKQQSKCWGVDSGHCYYNELITYNTGDAGYTRNMRNCADKAAISNDGICSNSAYTGGSDEIYDSHGQLTNLSNCSSIDAYGKCTAYGDMLVNENSYLSNGKIGTQYRKRCISISQTDPTTCKDNEYKRIYAYDSTKGEIVCRQGNGRSDISLNGTCTWGSLTAGSTYNYAYCTSYSKIDWTNFTCK